MGKRRDRADNAITEVRDRANVVLDSIVDGVEGAVGGGRRQLRKARRRVERSARKAERRLGHSWNRGRFHVRRVRRKATRRIDRIADKARSSS